MLVHRLRRWRNIDPTMDERLVLAGYDNDDAHLIHGSHTINIFPILYTISERIILCAYVFIGTEIYSKSEYIFTLSRCCI